jgi:Protein of unknown function (DUF2844)
MKIRWGLLLSAFLLAIPVWAALGDSVQSIQAEQKRWAGQLTSKTVDGYSVHEIRTASNAAIRQYASPGGTIFGVAWEGSTMPDLRELLGSYYPQFQAALAASAASRRRGPLYIQAGPLVVQSAGHMRAFHGRAYVTDLMPANVTQDVIQ